MAGSGNMKPFYFGLVFIALAGVAAILLARGKGSPTELADAAPVSVAAMQSPSFTLGSDSAPVKVTEYSSFICGWCARFAVLTMPDVKSRLIETGEVQWTYRDFPTGEPAIPAHNAAHCAGEQGRFWEMKDQLFYNQARWIGERRPERQFRDYARTLNLDLARFDACMDENRYVSQIEANRQSGQALGVSSTPTFIINGRVVPGFKPFDEFRAVIEQAAEAARR